MGMRIEAVKAWLRTLVEDGQVLKRSGNSFVGVDPSSLTPAGNFTPATTDAHDLGETSTPLRWRFGYFSRGVVVTHAATSSGIRTALTVTGAADLARTTTLAQPDVLINGQRTVTWATGAITAQSMVEIRAQTIAFAGASTVTHAATVDIDDAPTAGANATFTNGYALRVRAGRAHFGGAVTMAGDVTLGDAATDTVTITGGIAGNVIFRKEANHTLSVEASTTTDTAGGNLTIAAGAGGATNANGGNLALDAGAKAGSGTDGTVSVGATNANAVTVGRTGKTTTVPGALAVTQGSTLTGPVGVGAAADASAILTATSTTQGFLPPRMTEAQRDLISSPTEGLVIYNLTSHKLNLRVAAAWEVITSA